MTEGLHEVTSEVVLSCFSGASWWLFFVFRWREYLMVAIAEVLVDGRKRDWKKRFLDVGDLKW